MRDFDIHISDVGEFDRCRKAWDYASPLRRALTPKEKYSAFFVGSAVHHCLEHKYRSNTPIWESLGSFAAQELEALKDDLYTQHRAALDADLRLAEGLLKHYESWQAYDQTPLSDKSFDFIAPEAKFKVPLWKDSRKRLWLAGTFDGVVRHKETGRYYLWEIKTCRSIPEREKALDFDQQTKAYMLAAQAATGYEISGIVYTLLRKKLPKSPEPLKNGHRLSKAIKEGQGYNTSAHWYLKAVTDFHRGAPNLKDLIRSEYNDPIAELLQAGNSFQARVLVTPSQAELARFAQELTIKAKAMTSKLTPIYSSGGYHCNYCRFRGPCLTYNRQGPEAEALILDQSYIRNPRYSDEGEE